MSLPVVPPLISFAEWLFVAVVVSGPIGLVVLRRRLADSRGGVKAILAGLTAVTAPLAASAILVIVSGAFEVGDELWSLARAAW